MSGYFLTRQAHCDLEAAEDFLLPRNPDAAHRFFIGAVEVFELLAKNPERAVAGPISGWGCVRIRWAATLPTIASPRARCRFSAFYMVPGMRQLSSR